MTAGPDRAAAEAVVRSAIRGAAGHCLLDGLVLPWMRLTARRPRHLEGPWPPAADVREALATLGEDVPADLLEDLIRAEPVPGVLPTAREAAAFEAARQLHDTEWQLPPSADLSAHEDVDRAWRRIDPAGRTGNAVGLLSGARWWPGREAHADPAGLGGPARSTEEHPDDGARELVDALLYLVTNSPVPRPSHWMIAATDYRIRTARWLQAVAALSASLTTASGQCLLATVVQAVADDGAPVDERPPPRLDQASAAIQAAFARIGDPVTDRGLASLLGAAPRRRRGAMVRTPGAVIDGLDGLKGPSDRPKPALEWRLPVDTDTSRFEAARWGAPDRPPTGWESAGADWLLAATDRRVRTRIALHEAAPVARPQPAGWRRWLHRAQR